jgi:hypothetical protein
VPERSDNCPWSAKDTNKKKKMRYRHSSMFFFGVFCVFRGLTLLMFVTKENGSVLEIKSKITHDRL